MLDPINCTLSSKGKVSRQHLSCLLLGDDILVIASFGKKIDRPMTRTERQCTSRDPRVIDLRQHRVQTQRPQGLELRIEVVGDEHRRQPQKAGNEGHELPTAQIKNESDYGITVR